MSFAWRAMRLSCAVRSDSLIGVTIDQCLPTGQRWSLHKPSRTDLIEAAGIQIVV